jgi:hypothetical protein
MPYIDSTTTTIGATEFHEAVTEAEYASANATPRDQDWARSF